MHKKFANLFQCPVSHRELILDVQVETVPDVVESGRFRTNDGKFIYPIIGGIPRFVKDEAYSHSFGFEWRKWAKVQFENENLGGPMSGHTRNMFKKITYFTRADLEDKLVVDFGCGPGRFIDIVREMGGIAVGIDMSMAVEEAQKIFFNDENVLLVQGDILNPPFKKEIFDYGYTIGVLHHLAEPRQGFVQLAGLVRKGGKLACSVYAKNNLYDFKSVKLMRKTVNAVEGVCGYKLAWKLALAYSWFSSRFLYGLVFHASKLPKVGGHIKSFIERYLAVILDLPDQKWRMLDTFDAITPRFASTHEGNEIEAWYKSTGFSNIQKTNWGGTSFVGTK